MANEFKIKVGAITPTLQVTATTDSTDKDTGALIVEGGVGIEKNLTVGGDLVINGSFNPGNINNSQIGNITPSSGAFTTLTASQAVTFTQNAGSSTATEGTLVVTGGVGISQNLNVGGNTVITGNLTVNGTTTTINSTAVSVDDINIILGDTASPTDGTADGGGITLRGATNKTITWVQSTGRWTFNTGIESSTGIVNTPISGSTGSFTTLSASSTLTANSTVNLSPVGSAVSISPTGVGSSLSIAPTTGNMDNVAIGATTRNTGAFTTLAANAAVTFTQNAQSNDTTSGTLVVTGGTGMSGNLHVGGLTGLGTTARAGVELTVAAQSTTVTPSTGTNLHVSGANATVSRITNDSYGTGVYPAIMQRAARGTAAAPSATQLNDSIGRFGGSGYGDTSFPTESRARIEMFASQNWTDSAQGTYMNFYTTPNNTVTPTLQVGIDQTGIVTFYDTTNSTDATNGAVVINGGLGVVKDLRVNGDIYISNVKVQQIGQIITTSQGWNMP